jgi:transposase/3D (Asp-Asp-Asp) domain-containing protein
MSQSSLFELPPQQDVTPSAVRLGGRKRMRMAVRNQIEFQECSLDELVASDDQVRVVWDYVCQLDLSPLVDSIGAVEGEPGREPPDPRIFLALWLYATLRGVGSARELNRLCRRHIAYRWLCGGVTMNYHSLADFRTAHVDLLDQLLSQSVATLMSQDLVTLDRVAQDGMKVRASAGAASFRRGPTLAECLADAQTQVAALREELQSDPSAGGRRQKAARQRAAEERAARIAAALAQIPQIEAAKKTSERHKARASTTDADARVMKMGDGGFRPAYNVQLATDTGSQIITGVEVTNSGGDQGKLLPMVEQHEERYDRRPKEALVDGGFVKKDDIDELGPPHGGTTVYAPVMESKDPHRDPHTPRADDSPAVAEWRQRMATPEAKEIYKQRASTAECVNALARNRGLRQFTVRGLRKAKAVVLWFVLAHNLMRSVFLRSTLPLAVA